MRLTMADNTKVDSLASQLRRTRLQRFIEMLPRGKATHVLDMGGTIDFWEANWNEVPENVLLTIVNLKPQKGLTGIPIRSITGDARYLSEFSDGHFDYCFSNSVIEHVGTLADQRAMAREVRRIAGGYFLQTPYRYFPVEPHFHVPLWAQLPLWLRTALHQSVDLGWMPAQPEYLNAREDVEQIRLLSIREMRLLFPDAELRLERIGGLVKSIMAVRRHPTSAPLEALVETGRSRMGRGPHTAT
jgi:hypothetical protein